VRRNLLFAIVFLLLIFFTLSRIDLPSTSRFKESVQSLLLESNSPVEITGCFGGWVERRMYCKVQIRAKDLSQTVLGLGLDEELKDFNEGSRRLVELRNDQDPCDESLRKKYEPNFDTQQWTPPRHGFDSCILFFNSDTEEGCLYLDISYG